MTTQNKIKNLDGTQKLILVVSYILALVFIIIGIVVCTKDNDDKSGNKSGTSVKEIKLGQVTAWRTYNFSTQPNGKYSFTFEADSSGYYLVTITGGLLEKVEDEDENEKSISSITGSSTSSSSWRNSYRISLSAWEEYKFVLEASSQTVYVYVEPDHK